MNATEFLLGAKALERHGARNAILCGDERVTYAELAERMARSAGALASFGLKAGDRVAFLMRDTPEFAAAWLGALRIGAVAIALNNKLADADIRHILADGNVRLVLVEDLFAAARPEFAAELARDGRLVLVGDDAAGTPSWRQRVRDAGPAPVFQAEAETPALMLYSSGTTGRPKGIVHSHRAIQPVGLAFRELGLGVGDRILSTSKYFFAYGIEHGLLGVLAEGATAVVFPGWPGVEDVIQMVDRHRPTAMFSVPTIYRRLLAEPSERLANFRTMRRFVGGGERMSRQFAAQWKSTIGVELLNLYGMSETFVACVITPPGTSDGVRTGKPMAGVEVKLLDAEDREVPVGEPGVLWVKHPAAARAYANLPEQTAAQFRDGWFCSRDLFVRDAEGFLTHQGRSDELLKIAGQWVQPGEVEETVAKDPAITEAACVLVPDEDGLQRMALFVTVKGESAKAVQAAAEACERSLPRHKRPKWVRAVEEFPRTATGKVQRFKLRELLERELAGKD